MNELEALLRERIRREGPLSFRDVMDAALYHPQHGYYTNLQGFGAQGDFITSPERHPAFGWLLGRQALDVWEALDRPTPFRILELGGGSGALAEPLIGFVRQTVDELVYTIDEPSPSLRTVQQARLQDPVFRWASADEPADFVIANEVADALPVHRVIRQQGHFRELRVGLDEQDNLTWLDDEAPTAVETYFADLHHTPSDQEILDVCLELADWVNGLARRIAERGVGLVIDYTASPPRDSLLTYYRHTMGSDPLVRLGQQDISGGLLLNLGFQQVHARLTGPTDRQALASLVDPSGPGGQIAAVFLTRGLTGYKPVGAVGGRDWPPPDAVPSLPTPRQDEESDFLNQWHEAFPREETR